MTLVDVQGLHKSYVAGGERTHVLRGLELRAEKGEMVMIMGPSGSGKTTLLNILGGIDNADEGTVVVEEQDLKGLDKRGLNRYRREHVGFIFQFYNLIPTLTAQENVELGIEALLDSKVETSARARKYLSLVGLEDKVDNFPQELSAGEQQRVAIARALAKETGLILADEPTGNLDEERGDKIMELMRRLRNEIGTTFIVVTHNSRLRGYVDRTLDLRRGVLSQMA